MASLAALIEPAARAAEPDEAAFVAEVRAFLAEALTPDLREAGRLTLGVHADIEACHKWHGRLYARGWIAPAWPKAWAAPAGPRASVSFGTASAC